MEYFRSELQNTSIIPCSLNCIQPILALQLTNECKFPAKSRKQIDEFFTHKFWTSLTFSPYNSVFLFYMCKNVTFDSDSDMHKVRHLTCTLQYIYCNIDSYKRLSCCWPSSSSSGLFVCTAKQWETGACMFQPSWFWPQKASKKAKPAPHATLQVMSIIISAKKITYRSDS